MATLHWEQFIELANNLAPYSTTELSDALTELGHFNGGHIPDIGVQAGSAKLCGPAYTVEVVHAWDVQAPWPTSHYMDDAPKGAVIVIAAPQGQSVI